MAFISLLDLEARISMRQASSVPAPCPKQRGKQLNTYLFRERNSEGFLLDNRERKCNLQTLNHHTGLRYRLYKCLFMVVQKCVSLVSRVTTMTHMYQRPLTFIAVLSSYASYTGAGISRPRTTLWKCPLSSDDRSSGRSCGKRGQIHQQDKRFQLIGRRSERLTDLSYSQLKTGNCTQHFPAAPPEGVVFGKRLREQRICSVQPQNGTTCGCHLMQHDSPSLPARAAHTMNSCNEAPAHFIDLLLDTMRRDTYYLFMSIP